MEVYGFDVGSMASYGEVHLMKGEVWLRVCRITRLTPESESASEAASAGPRWQEYYQHEQLHHKVKQKQL